METDIFTQPPRAAPWSPPEPGADDYADEMVDHARHVLPGADVDRLLDGLRAMRPHVSEDAWVRVVTDITDVLIEERP